MHPVRPRTPEAEALIQRVRAICCALPDVTEKLSHGEATWARKRVFAMFDDHHHGAPHHAVWLAAPPGDQEALIAAEPGRFFRPPYVGHRGWIGVVLDGDPDWDGVAELIGAAWAEGAPRRR